MKNLIYLFAFFPLFLQAQLEKVGEFPGFLWTITQNGNDLYLVEQPNELSYLAADAEAWQSIEAQNIGRNAIAKLVAQDTLLFSMESNGAVSRSADGGRTFSPVLSSNRQSDVPFDLFHVRDSLYYYYYGDTFLVSNDHARTFSKVTTIEGLAAAGHLGEYVFYVCQNVDRTLFVKSRDNFTTADTIMLPWFDPRTPIQSITFRQQILLGTSVEGVLLRSNDFGDTWEECFVDDSFPGFIFPDTKYDRFRSAPRKNWASAFYSDDSTFYLATHDKLYKSADQNLQEWEVIPLPDIGFTKLSPGIQAIVKHNGQLCLFVNHSLILKYDGQSWSELITGLGNGTAEQMFEDDGWLYIQGTGTVWYKSADQGAHFRGACGKIMDQLQTGYGLRYLTVGEYQLAYYPKLYRSPQHEENWTLMNNGICVDLSAQKDTLWAIIDHGLHYSVDIGENWTLQYDFSAFLTKEEGGTPKYGEIISFHKVGNEIVAFALRYFDLNSQVLCSQDNGLTFEVSKESNFKSTLVEGQNILLELSDTSALALSTDLGKTWEMIDNPCSHLPNYLIYDEQFVGETIVLSTSDGLFYSSDHGMTWNTYYPELLEDTVLTTLFYHQGRWLTTGTPGGGVYELTHYPFSANSSDE